MHHSRLRERKKYVIPILMLIGISSCVQPDPLVLNLDKEYGFRGYSLGPGLYREVQEQMEERSSEFDVIEFETFGSRFADQQLFTPREDVTVFGSPVTNIFAGVLDRRVYALLFQIETDEISQAALADSLITYYGKPQAVTDTTYFSGFTSIRVNTLEWNANRVGLDFGMGDGFSEVLVYDRILRDKRLDIQEQIDAAQSEINPYVSDLQRVGNVRLNSTASTARWRYRFRGEKSPSPVNLYGAIDYSHVEPFFDIRGKSLYGVKMAFASMRFSGVSDSLNTLDVEFDNTSGQVVGFMDLFRVMERKLGRHAYSDTLYTIKGPYRRAFWYGDGLTVNVEEYRFRPESPSRSDVRVRFMLDNTIPEYEEPVYADDTSIPDSSEQSIISTVRDSSQVDVFH